MAPVLEFNYDISCPFAYIASTRIEALASRTSSTIIWRPVLLGAIYRATSAPQGAAGSASDVFNPTKRAVTSRSMQRTIKRYGIRYNPPPQHPRKTVNALRLLYHVPAAERPALSKALFKAYWVDGLDISNDQTLLQITRDSGVSSGHNLTKDAFHDPAARNALEKATADAIERGAFGVPGFWIPDLLWKDVNGVEKKGRFFWGQDRMHFVEASLLAMQKHGEWKDVEGLKAMMPRCAPQGDIGRSRVVPEEKVKLEFWYDFSSPWAFLGWTQLPRLKRTFGERLEIVMKPFLLGALFREIGAPMLPGSAVSPAKALYSRQDHADWVQFWNAVNVQEGNPDKEISFHWADVFPIRTPTVLRCALIEPNAVRVLYEACWEQNLNVADEVVLAEVLSKAGYDGSKLIQRASAKGVKDKLRELTAEAKAAGICGVPSFRVFSQNGDGEWENVGGIVWGQDELNVVEDLIAGWDEQSEAEGEVKRETILPEGKSKL